MDGTGDVGALTSLALAAGDTPVVAYYDYTNGDLKLASHLDSLEGKEIITVDSTCDVGRFVSLAVDTGNRPVLSYYGGTNGDLKVTRCGTRLYGLGTTVTTVDYGGDTGMGTSLVLDGIGRPVVSYLNVSQGWLSLMRCGDLTCTSWNAWAAADRDTPAGEFTSLALDASGKPVIAHYDAANGDLKLGALTG